MVEGSLSRRYAKALFQLAKDAGSEDSIGREIEEFLAAYSGSELQAVLTNPAFGIDVRRNVLKQVAQNQQLSPLSTRFLSLLLERDRLGHLDGIANRFRRLLNDAKGRVEAKVVSASALDRAMIDSLSGRLRSLSGKEVILQQEVEPALLGGLMVELEGKVYDGSIRTQLEKMKQRIARQQ